MNDLAVVPFQPEHLIYLDMREHERETLDVQSLLVQMILPTSHCGSIISNGEVVAVMGIVLLWDGVFQVFVVPGKQVKNFGITYVRTIRRLLDAIQETHKPHRMQTWSKADTQTDRWMKLLGFTCEGDMRYFTVSKDDYRMWARYGDGR